MRCKNVINYEHEANTVLNMDGIGWVRMLSPKESSETRCEHCDQSVAEVKVLDCLASYKHLCMICAQVASSQACLNDLLS
jgi:hypothetical protein